MNKRQRKKKATKYLPLMMDEFHLLSMSADESKKAIEEFSRFRERFAYKKKYKDLKQPNRQMLYYMHPVGKTVGEKIAEATREMRELQKPNYHLVTQSFEDNFNNKQSEDQ